MNPIFLKRQEVEKLVGLSHFTLHNLEKVGKFPKRKQITTGRVAWLYSDVVAWAADLKYCSPDNLHTAA